MTRKYGNLTREGLDAEQRYRLNRIVYFALLAGFPLAFFVLNWFIRLGLLNAPLGVALMGIVLLLLIVQG